MDLISAPLKGVIVCDGSDDGERGRSARTMRVRADPLLSRHSAGAAGGAEGKGCVRVDEVADVLVRRSIQQSEQPTLAKS